ncbi:MAG TPA: type II secretion system protein GspM [Rhizomicrobium sp.]|nr:type II secretion system protein GspM [Rhizomicrobium sp.]
MKPLTPRERKLVAVAIALALFTGAWTFAAGPVLNGMIDRAVERSALRAEIARNTRIVAGLPAWRAELAKQQETAARFAIVAPSQDQARGVLSSRIRELVLENGGTVKSIQTGDEEGNEQVRVRANVQLTMEQLYHTLKQLEIGEPYVTVEYLSVVADTAFQTGHLATMEVRIEVSARCRATAPAEE